MLDERIASSEGLRDRMLVLRSFDTLGTLSDDELLALAERMRPRHHDAGEMLLTQEQTIDKVYFVVEGRVAIERDGRQLLVIERGRAAGLLAAMSRGDDTGVDARAEMETSTLELEVSVLMEAFRRYPSLLRHFLRGIANKLLVSRGYLPTQESPENERLGTYLARPKTLAENIVIMRTAGILGEANLDAVFEMVQQARPVRFSAGDELWALGDASTFSYVVDYGRIRCTGANGDTKHVATRYLLGGLESLAGAPRPYSATAETDLVLLRNEVETFLALLESHSDVGMTLLSALSENLLKIGAGV